MVFKPKYIQVCTLNEALELHRGNKTSLAKELGLTRLTLRRHLEGGGHQLCQVVTDDDNISFKYINKNWVK
tara:strand:+ start:1477 stop:1689 length:213 start_codon:yes stop_codon:yes gene_type:complete